MMRNTLTLILLLTVSGPIRAQLKYIDFLKAQLEEKGSIACISTEHDRFGKEIPALEADTTDFQDFPRQLVKDPTGLYQFINGTGVIYRITMNGDSIRSYRLDNTTSKFYNQEAYAFSTGKKIYNIGGYGHWHMNGMLRVYNPELREWDIAELNELKPIKTRPDAGNFFYHDLKNHALFVTKEFLITQGLKTPRDMKSATVNRISVLDLNSLDWRTLGEPSSFFSRVLSEYHPLTDAPFGEMVYSLNEPLDIYVLDYLKNKVFLVGARARKKLEPFNRGFYDHATFFKDSTLYIGSRTFNTLDTVQIHAADLIDTGEEIYVRQLSALWRSAIPGILLVSGISLLLFFKARKRRGRVRSGSAPSINMSDTVSSPDDKGSTFNAVERSLLDLLYANSVKGIPTSVSGLNTVLGLAKKSVEIQKRGRSQAINTINAKASAFLKTEAPIIKRARSSEDKRISLYLIDTVMWERFKETNDGPEGH